MSGSSKNAGCYYYYPEALSPLMEGPLCSSAQPRGAHLRDDAGGGRSSLELLSWLNFRKKKQQQQQQLEQKWMEEGWNAGSMAKKKKKKKKKKQEQKQQQLMQTKEAAEEEDLDVMMEKKKKKKKQEKQQQQQQLKKKKKKEEEEQKQLQKNGGRGFDSRLLLGVLGCPLAPISVCSNEPFPHLSIKNVSIEASSAQYIIYQYMAATGASRYRAAVRNAFVAGRVRMALSETETASKKSGGFTAKAAIAADLQRPPLPSSSSSSPSPLSLLSGKKKKRKKAVEHGRFVLWQMMAAANHHQTAPQQQQQQQQHRHLHHHHHHQQQRQHQQQSDRPQDAHDKWHLELALGGAAMQAGCSGKVVWRCTPWLGAHAAKGQVRPLRRALQGLDPVTTAALFAGARCVGERRVGEEDCFVLRVAADQEALRQRSEGEGEGGAEVIRHAMTGCFSQRTGLLLALEDWHLTRINNNGGGAVYWETAVESRLADYRPVAVDDSAAAVNSAAVNSAAANSGVQLAHSGRSCATLFRFGAAPMAHSRTSLLESWSIDDVAFNVPGLSHDFFLPPADLLLLAKP